MANNEIVKILKVETQGSERTVKSLKDEISALKDALLNTQQGTKQYDDIVKQLRTDQEDLTRVMNAGKQDVEALEGSYNYLVNTMKELKKEWRATTSEVRRNELGQQIDSINTKLKDMDASIGNYQRNVGNYAEGFSEAMKNMKDSTELTRAKLESVQKIASGLASGYAAVQGAMALFGVENEKLTQTFVKLQAAIALAQGIGGMKDLIEGLGMARVAFKSAVMGVKTFITSLNGVKAAIAGTGIGLLVVAIGSLVQILMELKDENEEATESVNELGEAMDRLKSAIDKVGFRNSQIALEHYKQAVIDAKGDVEKLKQAQDDYNKELERSEIIHLQAAKAEWERKLAEANRENLDWRSWMGDDKFKKSVENIKKAEQELQSINQRILQIEEKTQNAIVNAAVEAYEEVVKKAKDKKEQIEDIHNRILDSFMTEREVALNKLERKYEEEKELLKGRKQDLILLEIEYNKNVNAINEKYEKERLANAKETSQKMKDELDSKIIDINTEQGYKEQETELKYAGQEVKNPVQEIQLEIEKLNELRGVRLEAHNERLQEIDELLSYKFLEAKVKENLEKEKANLVRENAIAEKQFIIENSELAKQKIEEEKRLKRQQVSASIDVTRNLLDATSKLFKENSKEQKGIATAVATIDALKSANAAYSAMAGIPYVGPVLGAAAAAAALIAGYANVKAIWETNEDGSNANATLGSSSSSASVTPTFNAEQAMPIEYTRNILTSAETDELNKPQKVYVLESDITETQNKVEVTENNATF